MSRIRSRGVSALLVDQDGPENGWTGGQYSLYRVLLAVALVAVTAGIDPMVDPWDRPESHWWYAYPEVREGFQLAFVCLAIPLLLGWFDRVAAAIACVLTTCVSMDPFWVLLVNLLFAHAFTDSRPYGSIGAWGRIDPGGGWRRTRNNTAVAAFMTVRLLWLGPLSKVHDGNVELLAVFMAVPVIVVLSKSTLSQRVLAVPLLVICLVGWVGSAVSAFGVRESEVPVPELILLGALTLAIFDPALIPGRRGRHPEIVYYDGDCGLCHRTVRFLLAEDLHAHFRFAALQSDHFAEHVTEAEREGLADSVIVRTADGRLLQRSSAVVHLLFALGGLWRVLGSVLWCIPRPLRDFGYDVIARARKRLFQAPQGLCPLIPAELGARFLG
ncbi:MAG: DUF393 domain-containing protein [Planctomycetes bacterium]|nr:DUF393 domain-containing protein [Planctomycetota bacterium]MCB9904638.1 DUF393 domain-containing protein [Planctomycetota bacterium]